MTDTNDNVIPLPGPAERAVDRLVKAHNKAWHDNLPVAVNPSPATEVKPTPPSVRTIARQGSVDIATLVSILEYMRPDQSQTECDFVEMYLDPIEGMQCDTFGNRYLIIGENPEILWSCHTDTVSTPEGKQNVKWDGDFLVLNQPKQGQCLGADDGAGMWLLLEMIKAAKPGLYLFHRAEEVGGLGSKHLAKETPELLEGIKMAIAFDRRSTGSVITRQRGGECCSKEFGMALANLLSTAEGLDYDIDPTGTFTDTASYIKLIPECTNVSVGYYSEHTTHEKLDVRHLLALRNALLTLDFTGLPVKRDPTKVESYYQPYTGNYGRHYRKPEPKSDFLKIQQIVEDRPGSVARMLYNMGFGPDAVTDACNKVWERSNFKKEIEKDDAPRLTTIGTPQQGNLLTREDAESNWQEQLASYYQDHDLAGEDVDDGTEEDPETDFEERLWCNDCADFPDGGFQWAREGDSCFDCGGRDTILAEVEINVETGDPVDA